MFKTPQKRGTAGSASSYSASKRALPKGLFQNGIWKCDCNPRLPASGFQVKKEGPNKGRWFYTCQEPKGSGCGFFLWDDDAVGREANAVMGNTRSEPEQMTPADASMDKRIVEGHTAASNKFMANLARKDDNEFGDWSLSSEEERKLVQAVEREDAFRETPRKAIKTDQYATPGLKRKREDETLPTPITGSRSLGYKNARREEDNATPSSPMSGGSEPFGLCSPSYTPTPSRFREVTETSDTPGERLRLNYDITVEVMELLDGHKIEEEVLESLRELLKRHSLRILGITKGRDTTRLALKTKDAKIAELQQNISALETERELDKTIIRHFKNDMTHSIEKRRGQGRGKP